MSVIETVKDFLESSTQNPNRGGGATESKGAYWCHDCDVRIVDLEVKGEEPPGCPDCGDEMEFDRSAGSTGCAC